MTFDQESYGCNSIDKMKDVKKFESICLLKRILLLLVLDFVFLIITQDSHKLSWR